MSSRDMAINIVNMMNDEQIDNFVKLFRPIVSEIPNEETLRAIEETEEMLKNNIPYKIVGSFYLASWNIV